MFRSAGSLGIDCYSPSHLPERKFDPRDYREIRGGDQLSRQNQTMPTQLGVRRRISLLVRRARRGTWARSSTRKPESLLLIVLLLHNFAWWPSAACRRKISAVEPSCR